MKHLAQWLNTIFVIILCVIFVSLLYSRIGGEEPSLGGYRTYVVKSGSMGPSFDVGSIILVKEMQPQDVAVGDIITYRSIYENKSYVTHRVVEIDSAEGLKFITRGDANNTDDPMPVSEEQVVGKVVWWIPWLGYVVEFIRSKIGAFAVVIMPAIILIVVEILKIKQNLSTSSVSDPSEG